MSRSLLAASLLLLSLASCKRESPAPATPRASDSGAATGDPVESTNEVPLPEVHVRGWSIFQEVVDSNETRVEVWAPGDHLKEAALFFISDLFREHSHFAEWSDGSLFAIRHFGSTDGKASSDQLWEYRDGSKPRRIASGQALDFAIAPDGARIVIVSSDSATDKRSLRVLDRSGKLLAERSVESLRFEYSPALWMGDSLLWMTGRSPADHETSLRRWSLATDSVTEVAWPEEASAFDMAILPDRELLVASDAQPQFVDEESAEANRQTVVLRRFDLRTGSVAEIARRTGSEFGPVFVEGDSLEFGDPAKPGETRRMALP